jgi:hypothetical protein
LVAASEHRRGEARVVAIFERMGADSAAPDYVRPAENDVWAFIRGVARWINDPNRAVHVGQRRIGSG